MTAQHAHRLRELCVGYPRSSVTEALSVAVAATASDEDEQQALSTLLAAWVSDDRGMDVPPPIDQAFVERVWRALQTGSH